MKLNEIIKLNGKEYKLELNRESIVRIEQYVNMEEANEILTKQAFEDKSKSEIKDNENPFAEVIDDDEIEKLAELKSETLKKVYIRAYWIWLYPTEKLSIKEVEELLTPYLEDETKAQYIADKYLYFTEKSVEIRQQYLQDQKNLKAQTK